MTRLQMIQAIGDLLTRLDVLRGSLLPGDPHRQQLDDFRLLLNDRQRKLAREQIDEETPVFRAAAGDLAQINADLRQTVDRIERLVDTINGVRRLLSAVDTVLGVAV